MQLYTPRKREEREHTLPLVNIVFLLLIFFMLAGQLTNPDAFEIKPPESSSDKNPERGPMSVSIAADGRLAVAGEEITTEALPALVRERVQKGTTSVVRLKADGGVDAQRVIEVMGVLREVGVDKVLMLTQPEAG